MQITFSGYAGRAEALTNFPVLVVLSNNVGNSGFSFTGQPFLFTNGCDLRFKTNLLETGSSTLAYEIESFNTGSAAYVWVKVPVIPASGQGSIWATWGDASDSNSLACTTNGATWDQWFRGVYHMGSTNDSTSNRVNASISGPVSFGPAVSCAGNSFSGNGAAYLDLGNPYPSLSNHTVSGWLYCTNLANASGSASVLSYRRNNAGNGIPSQNVIYNDGRYGFAVRDDAGTIGASSNTPGSVTANNWRYFAGIRSGNSLSGVMGTAPNQYTASPAFSGAMTGNHLLIGALDAGGAVSSYWQGYLDEIRISSVARSTNWLWAEYQTLASNSTFASYGGVMVDNLPCADTGAGATGVGLREAWLGCSLVSTGGSPTVWGVVWGTNNPGATTQGWLGGGAQDFGMAGTAGISTSLWVGGLSPETTWYYASWASNAAGISVALPVSFTTLPLRPVIVNAGVSNITDITADVYGLLTSTGESACVAYVMYGTNAAALSFTNVIGASGAGVVSSQLSGLIPNSAYYFQFAAGNAAGTGAAPSLSSFQTLPVTHYVNPSSATPVSPYSSWATASTTIQEAIDASGVGDTVLVTNGVYSTGGRAVVAGFTNRVCIDRAITVRSVNGPEVTTIVGVGPLGSNAVRCAYVCSNAVLAGFTLTNGATRTSGDWAGYQAGGGAWCEASGVVSNCLVLGNSAGYMGGGIYYGIIRNCRIAGNYAPSGGGVSGGVGSDPYKNLPYTPVLIYNSIIENNMASSGAGVQYGKLYNCAVAGNRASSGNGGAVYSILNQCTVVGNSAFSYNGGVNYVVATNSIIYWNTARGGADFDPRSYFDSQDGVQRAYAVLTRCCTPLFSSTNGTGNIATEPQLVSAWRIAGSSPCFTNGSAGVAIGADLDGEAWRSPPSIGCDEPWSSAATGSLSVAITSDSSCVATGRSLSLTALIGGVAATNVWNFGDGVCLTNRAYASHTWNTAGVYTVTLTAFNASNPSGVSTSLLVRVDAPGVRYVNVANPSPVAPYASWETAAVTIQDAVDAAVDGDTVWVTNGVYASGGRTVWRSKSRVAVRKKVRVQSINGAGVTFIQGEGPVGTSAVRCAYLGSNAVLVGFTLTNGATSTEGDANLDRSGGGVTADNGGVVSNCVITGNQAASSGGGACFAALSWCRIVGNQAGGSGGGAYLGSGLNSVFERNRAFDGGGAQNGYFTNCAFSGNIAARNGGGIGTAQMVAGCTVVGNRAGVSIGGVGYGTYVNTIVYANSAPGLPDYDNTSAVFSYSCVSPLPAGAGNIPGPPELASCYRLAAGSPCIGAGSNMAQGVDIDGRSWATPPSIGACEGAGLMATGALSVVIACASTNVAVGELVPLQAYVTGEAASNIWVFGDGAVTNNAGALLHAWSTPGEYTVNLRVFNADHPDGVGTVVNITVREPVTLYVDAASAAPAYPFTSWQTAATTIQDAVDAALDGDLVLVTNGVYQTGGGRLASAYYDNGMTPNSGSRVVVEKRIEVRSVNGAGVTTIRGSGTTNGPNALRCVYLGLGAKLTGFSLEGGHTTRSDPPDNAWDAGGGARCAPGAIVSYCTIRSNAAWQGGAAYGGEFDHCSISANATDAGNSSAGTHGAILRNCLVTGHTNGYGFYNGAAYNCTIAGNRNGTSGGVLVNTITYSNTSVNATNTTAATNCCSTPLLSGAGCISVNPLFVNPAAGDYRLNGASACVDGGMNLSGMGITNDLMGTDRPLEGTGEGSPEFDIGCYEFNAEGASVPPIPLSQSAVISCWAPSYFKAPYIGGLGYTSRVVLVSGASRGTVTTTNNWFHYVPSSTNYQGTDSFTWRINYTGAGTSGVSATVTFSLTLRDGPTNDWTQWRYDEHRTASAPVMLPPTLTLQWRRDIPVVPKSYNSYPDLEYCRPVQLGKTLFVPIHASDSLAAYDTDSGSNKWTFYASGAIRRPPLAMVLTNGTNIVVVGSEDGNVYALNATDGSVYWKFQAAPNANKAMGFGRLGSVWPVCMSPVASNGRLYFGAGFMPSWCLYLYCVDAASGAVVWRNDGRAMDNGQTSGIGPLTVSTDHTKVYGANGKRNAWSVSASAGTYLGLLGKGTCSFYVDGNGEAPFYEYRENGKFGTFNPSETMAITTGDRTISATTVAGMGVAGTVGSLLAGDGKLFVTTAQGSIYCFGGTPPAQTNIYLNSPVALAATTDVWTAAAGSMLSRADLKQGLALVWGVGSGRLVEELARQGGSNLMVVACDPDPAKLRAIRVRMDAAGWSGARVSTIEGNPMECGFAPYQAGLIASEDINVAGWSYGQALPLKLYECTRPFGGEIWLPTLNGQHAAIQSWLAATNLPMCGGAASYTVSQVTGFAAPGANGFTRICRTGFPDSKLALRPPFRPVAFGEEYSRNSASLNLVPSPAISRGVKASGGYWSGPNRDIYTWLPAPAAMTGYEPAGQGNTVNGSVSMPSTLMNPLYGVVEPSPAISAYGDCGNHTTYGNWMLNPGKMACVWEASANYWGGWYIGDRGGCSWHIAMYRALAGNGMLAMSGGDSGCGCGTAQGLNATQCAVVSAPGEETWLRVRTEASKQLIQEMPVKRVGINFGGVGDRYVPEEQMLWTHYPYSGWIGEAGPLLSFGVRGTATRRYHHSAQMPQTLERDRRWVSASQITGMTGITVHVAMPVVSEPAVTPPVLDGELTDDCWTNQPAWRLNSSDARVMVRTDSTNIYIGGYLNASLSGWTRQRSMRVGLSSRANTGVRVALSCSTQYGNESSVIGTNAWQGAYVDGANRFSAEMVIPWSALTAAGIATNQLLMNFSVCGQRLHGSSFQNAESLAYGLQYNEAQEIQYFSPVYQGAATGSVATLRPHAVRLYFAEMDDLLPTQRVFDVSLQGVKVLTNLDVVAETLGGRRELVKEFTGVMIASTLDIDFAATAGQPMISGVEIMEITNNLAPEFVSGPAATPNPAGTGVVVQFSVAAKDLNGDALSYNWTFGDPSSPGGSAAANPTHVYATAGTYTARVAVSDGTLAVTGVVTVAVLGEFDSWRADNFGWIDLPGTAAGDDWDGDGMSNSNEWRAGTSPVDASSRLEVAGFGVQGAGLTNLVLTWSSVSGRLYSIDCGTNLMDGFAETVSSHIPATPDVNTATVQVEQAAQRFYRVRVE